MIRQIPQPCILFVKFISRQMKRGFITIIVLNIGSWLKQIWSCESVVKKELSYNEAIKLARGINPFVSKQNAKRIVTVTNLV